MKEEHTTMVQNCDHDESQFTNVRMLDPIGPGEWEWEATCGRCGEIVPGVGDATDYNPKVWGGELLVVD